MAYNSNFITNLKNKLSTIDSPVTPLVYLLCEETEEVQGDNDQRILRSVGKGKKIVLLTERNARTSSSEVFILTTPELYSDIEYEDITFAYYLGYTLEDMEIMATYIVEHYMDIYYESCPSS